VTRIEQIRQRLFGAFESPTVDVADDSHRHIGHAGAADGRGHYSIRVVSSSFDGLPAIARHRAIYQAMGTLMQTDIHALAIDARTPDEAGQGN
jgi:BolA protein